MTAPTVSIIIATRNRASHLLATLRSVGELQIPAGLSAELVLVDNGSTDDTQSVYRRHAPSHFPARLVHVPTPGVANARNGGLAAARGRVVMFSDDDVRLPRDWIARMAGPILSDAADVVAGGVELAPHLQRNWMQVPDAVIMLGTTGNIDPDSPERIVTANLAVKSEVFDTIPGFDPELGAGQIGMGEDTLFAYQARAAGFRLQSAFDVVAVHEPDASRLARASYLDAAEKVGRSEAYIRFHWQHHFRGYRLHPAWIYYNMLLGYLRLWRWRRTHREALTAEEGLRRGEFQALQQIYTMRQLLEERKRGRLYPRRGARKPGCSYRPSMTITDLPERSHATK